MFLLQWSRWKALLLCFYRQAIKLRFHFTTGARARAGERERERERERTLMSLTMFVIPRQRV